VKVAIVIGSYKMPEFVWLNAIQCLTIFDDDVPLLVSDDRSDKTGEIESVIQGAFAAFTTSNVRRGHCGGVIQAFVNGLAWAEQEKCDILLKLNQRFIPVLPEFRELVEKPFEDPKINIVVPGRSVASKLKQPSSKYFAGLGILVDAVAIRVGVLSPAAFLKKYTDNFKFGTFSINLLPEIFFGQLLASTFQESTFVSSALGDGKVEKRAFFRREQSTSEDYKALAAKHQFGGEFDCRDWLEIEGANLMMRPILTT